MCSKLIAPNIVLDLVLLEIYKEGIKIRYANSFKQRCYPIFSSLMVGYKEQILITDIKANMQCFICHLLLKEGECLTKKSEFWTHELTWKEIKRQRNNLVV